MTEATRREQKETELLAPALLSANRSHGMLPKTIVPGVLTEVTKEGLKVLKVSSCPRGADSTH